MRWQDNRMRRIDNSDKVIDFYNREVRGLVIVFLKQFTQVVAIKAAQPSWRAMSIADRRDFYDMTATRLGLATILHLTDKIAWLLDQNSYLDREEILATIGSETSRLFINDEYELMIQRMLSASSLKHIQELITILKGIQYHDERK